MKEVLEAYCLKTKKKEEMQEVIIEKTKRGGYIAKGVTSDGNKLSLILSKDRAESLIKQGYKQA